MSRKIKLPARFKAVVSAVRISKPRSARPWIIGITAAVLLLVAAIAWSEPNLGQIVNTLPTTTPVATRYVSDLYHFETYRQPAVTYEEVATPCRGTLFTERVERQNLPATQAEMYVCYLGPTKANSTAALQKELDNKVILDVNLVQIVEPQVGVPQIVPIGKKQSRGVERYLTAQDATDLHLGKWYTAVVQYEGRLYGIVATSPQEVWDESWPAFRSLIANLDFESGVIPGS